MGCKIFINYQRGQDDHFAGRLGERLSREFKEDVDVFMDVDNIPASKDFKMHLEEQ
jgi:hypothetical protein